MRVKILVPTVALIALLAFPTVAFAATWDLATDYAARGDGTSPPSAKDSANRTTWYFKYSSPGNATNPASYAANELAWVNGYSWMPDATGIKGWTRSSTWTHISVNTGPPANSNTTPGFMWQSGWVLGHPMPYSDSQPFVVVEWRSPVAGSADVSALVADIDSGGGDGVEYWLLKNSTVLSQSTVGNGTSATPSVNNVAVVAGDSIYLVLGPGTAGDHGWDTTRLNLTVTVPDPPVVSTPASSGWTLALLGVLGLAGVARRRHLSTSA